MTGEEFKQRFMPYSGKLYAVALSLTCNEQEAEDAVQDAFLRLWTRRDSLPSMENADKAKSDVFNNTTAELDPAYEPIVTVFEDDDRVKVLGRAEGDVLKEVVVAVSDNEDCVMVCFTGSIPKDKIGQLVNDKTISF